MRTYSWIARQLDIECTPTFLLLMPNFKSETSFGFVIENYTRHVLSIFRKIKNELALGQFSRFEKKVFSRGDLAQYRSFELRFLLSRTIVSELRLYN